MGAPSNTLVCFAVKEEAASFRQILDARESVDVLLTGIGPANARRTVQQQLQEHPPRLVLSCGFAGALNPKFAVGDVLFEGDSNAGLDAGLQALGAIPARFHCVDRVAVTAVDKSALWRTTGADAVEMESSVIRALCRERGIPGATVRVISDAANEDLPLDFNAVMTADQRISFAKLAGAVLKSPGAVPRLMRLQRDTRRAAGRLAEVLRGLLNGIGTGGHRGGV